MKTGIKVFAPASLSNLACGFDVLGLALEGWGDEVLAKKVDQPGVTISAIYGDRGTLPLVATANTAGVAAAAVLAAAGVETFGLELEIRKRMPIGSGLGSSAASAVAGAVAANAFLLHPFDKRELLPFAIAGEEMAHGSRQADNVAASLLGGIVFVRDAQTYDIHRLYTPSGLFIAVVHPHLRITTKESRAILAPAVPLAAATQQAANLGAFVLATMTSNLPLLSRTITDLMVEPQRAAMIPNFYAVKQAALAAGAMGCSLSGSGPAMFAICQSRAAASGAADAMVAAFAYAGIPADAMVSLINVEGATLL